MSFYPILIQLEGKKAVVVGGGMVAQRKIDTLLAYHADVHVISRDLTPTLSKYLEEGRIGLLGHEFRDDYLDGAFIVIAATDDPLLNRQVSEKTSSRGLLINAVDQPADCSFIVPSILRRGDLLVAVSTSGKSPAFAKKVREELEEQFGDEYGSFLALMGRLRGEILGKGLSQDENKRIFLELVNSHILDAIAENDWNEVATILNRIMNTQKSSQDVINDFKAG
ncbi:MAG: bifunctional precorrin-2 dehydrogenase/sirohydrochlorin ferrochelatase [Pseudomonadota bacterium]